MANNHLFNDYHKKSILFRKKCKFLENNGIYNLLNIKSINMALFLVYKHVINYFSISITYSVPTIVSKSVSGYSEGRTNVYPVLRLSDKVNGYSFEIKTLRTLYGCSADTE